ncbi:MAG TPA: hypothetical protein PK523_10720 [Elusimicrobiales bacterium]|nr:hypothetical protein [Elusimicrobiales bacterium]
MTNKSEGDFVKIFVPIILILVFVTGCASQARRERVDNLMVSRDVELMPEVKDAQSSEDYPKPSPTRALVQSIVLPGAGHYYVSQYSHDSSYYAFKGSAFLLAGIASFLYAREQIKDNPQNGILLLLPISVKLFEFDQVVVDAERERAENLKNGGR